MTRTSERHGSLLRAGFANFSAERVARAPRVPWFCLHSRRGTVYAFSSRDERDRWALIDLRGGPGCVLFTLRLKP